jgi:hypothetical protein
MLQTQCQYERRIQLSPYLLQTMNVQIVNDRQHTPDVWCNKPVLRKINLFYLTIRVKYICF